MVFQVKFVKLRHLGQNTVEFDGIYRFRTGDGAQMSQYLGSLSMDGIEIECPWYIRGIMSRD